MPVMLELGKLLFTSSIKMTVTLLDATLEHTFATTVAAFPEFTERTTTVVASFPDLVVLKNKLTEVSDVYKRQNGYSREMEHWVTGGGVLGFNNNGDTGKDVATFHYRSEINLITRAANQHVALKG